VLTGKYHPEEAAKADEEKDVRFADETMQQFLPEAERLDGIISAVRAVSQEVGRSMAQVALAWLRHRDQPIIPIVGARKLHQLRDNLSSLELELTPDQMTLLDEASAVSLGFPHEFFQRDMVRTFVHAGLRDRIVG
jgi:aryl-alcohol dehydrogenase-like predicted oxidoreductase